MLPTDYHKFLRVHARANIQYTVVGDRLEVIGLFHLGGNEGVNGIQYDYFYTEDGDNYIAIIIVGDDAAMRKITHLEIPSLASGYAAFYNPGGPGPTPYPVTSYTAPGPPDLEPLIMALDNPIRISN